MPVISNYIGILILTALVFLAGERLIRMQPVLGKLNLPTSVIGALVFLPFLRVSEYVSNLQLPIPSPLRDILLVVFFCSMGLAIKFNLAVKGGNPLLVLCLLSVILVIFQNVLGVSIALLLGYHPAYGLLAGSISYVGGFGSSLAWGSYYAKAGLPQALEFGFACSTIGLLSGGLLAGPVVAWLINRRVLTTPRLEEIIDSDEQDQHSASTLRREKINGCELEFTTKDASTISRICFFSYAKVIAAIGISIMVGDYFQVYLKTLGIELPRFLSAMLISILLVNILGRGKFSLEQTSVDAFSELSFNSFIILSLLGMSITSLSDFIVPISVIFVFQIILTVLFATEVVYRIMGKNYEAAVLSGGVIGFGLSSLAVAVATVKTITKNNGPAPRALLLTSLVGAALIDLPNNLLIGLLARLEFFSFTASIP